MKKGVPTKTPVLWEEDEITSVLTKEIKYLGKVYDDTLTDKQQIEQTLKKLQDGVKRIDKTFIAGKNKCWILQTIIKGQFLPFYLILSYSFFFNLLMSHLYIEMFRSDFFVF